MSKVIVERPRVGGGAVRKGRVSKNYDDMPQKESMARNSPKHGWNGKQLNENLSPLERFMESRVGKLWDKVFSEICENIRVTSTVQQHIRDHVKWMVETKGLKKNGKKVLKPSRYRSGTEFRELTYGDLYVDPETGILCKYKHNRYKKQKTDPMQRDLEYLLNEQKSKFLVEGGYAYKLYPDHEKKYTVKHKATQHHAELDFQRIAGYSSRSHQLDSLIRVWNTYHNRFTSKCPYFARMRELIMANIKWREQVEDDKIKDTAKAIKTIQKEFGLNVDDASSCAATRSWKKARQLAKELMDNLTSTPTDR